ncbi:MAG: thiamine biosynthesis protein ApbE [Planctomycetaceae bacterium]|nr:thiamine biosynthesis protein ApbE [Planctomycetaceae bacterium]
MSDAKPISNRREFLTGGSLQKEAAQIGERFADELGQDSGQADLSTSETLRLSTTAMACEFAVILNLIPSAGETIEATQRMDLVSEVLDSVHALESQMSVYRDDSELSAMNRTAYENDVCVESRLHDLLKVAERICAETNGGFDPTARPLVALWRSCRQESRVPLQQEIDEALSKTGIEKVQLGVDETTVRFQHPNVEFDLGGIGKGYALDRMGESLLTGGVSDWMIHGGHSSILAHGDHNGLGGWPVGIRNPLFPAERWASVILRDEALSSSGSGVQFFRHGGKRYGHILDPRRGWPVDDILSVTVIAPTAAEADALSTAFFVVGLENAREYCDNHPQVRAIVIPKPPHGRTLQPHVIGVDPDALIFLPESLSQDS